MIIPPLRRLITHWSFLLFSVVVCITTWLIHSFFIHLDQSFITEILWLFDRNVYLDNIFFLLYWITPAIFWLFFLAFFAFSNRRDTFIVSIGIIIFGGLVMGDLLKAVFSLERPAAELREWLPPIYKAMAPSETHDFPGQSSMMPAAVVTYFTLKNTTTSEKGVFYILFILASILTRPYLGMNYLSGTIAGAFIGIYIGFLAFEVEKHKTRIELFNNTIYRVLTSLALFLVLLTVYIIILERPWVYKGTLEAVDLDLRMFTMILGGLLGLSLDVYPKQEPLIFTKRFSYNFILLMALFFNYFILIGLYIAAILFTTIHLIIGLVFSIFAGLWITSGGSRVTYNVYHMVIEE